MPTAKAPKPSKKTAKHSADTKAAVLAALLSGQGTAEIAKEFSLPENTVKSWRTRLKDDDGGAKNATIAPQKREEIGDLLVDYLRANLSTLRKQLEVFGDPAWLKLQSAADNAVLHGVMTDKSIRLLEALGGVHESAAS